MLALEISFDLLCIYLSVFSVFHFFFKGTLLNGIPPRFTRIIEVINLSGLKQQY